MPFELQILHAADQEAGLPALDDAPRFSAVVNALRDDYANTVILSSGDAYIPGPFFSASSDPSLSGVLGSAGVGRADILIQNEIGFQAIAFGNHEFDLGTATVQSLIAPSGAYVGTQFPYLSANLDFSTDPSLRGLVVPGGQEASTIPNSITDSTVITVNGERIGVVGATTPTLRQISSPGGVTVLPPDPNDLSALAAEIQRSVDALTATGINKVVLLAHLQQIALEQALAPLLSDVDVIMAGGSNTLLADPTDRLRPGDTAQGPYPILSTNADGDPIAIINTDGNYQYVGRLVATFDDNGVLLPGSIDAAISGAYATDAAGVAAVGGTPDPEVVAITDALREVIITKDSNIVGSTTDFLNGTRNAVRSQETNLGNVTADAQLFVAQQIDPTTVISLKNGGGIRDNIGAVSAAPGATDPNDVEFLPPPANPAAGKEEGDISQLDIENSLRFNNALSLVTVTAEQLLRVIEHGVAASSPGATPGQFPQIGGISFSFDPDLPSGNRVLSLAVKDEAGNTIDVVTSNGELVGDPSRTFRLVTLSFLADGGDRYPFPEFAAENPTLFNRVDLTSLNLDPGAATFAAAGTEQDAFAEYLAQVGEITAEDVSPELDTRIQNLNFRNDAVFDDIQVDGAGGQNTFEIAADGDVLFVQNFGGVGAIGDQTAETAAEVDTLKFVGEGFTAENLLLTQNGSDVIVAFEGVDNFQLTLRNTELEDLENNANGIGNFLFDGDTSIQDTIDVFNDNWQVAQLFYGENRVTFLNDLDNTIQGLDRSDDVINGQGGNDKILGRSGDDILRGGAGDDALEGGAGDDRLVGGDGFDILSGQSGDDTLVGGAGNDLLTGGIGSDVFVLALEEGVDTIRDFSLGQGDQIGLAGGLTFDQLTLADGNIANSTLISANGQDLAVLLGISSSNLSSDNFVLV
jgi:2',3'-cyclic-nucleotide 2'-phosphodiesterase (5'-nucleotidase family)